jgi:hypothetical protein
MQMPLSENTFAPVLTPLFFFLAAFISGTTVWAPAVANRAVVCFALPAGDYLKHLHHRENHIINAARAPRTKVLVRSILSPIDAMTARN